MKHSTHYQLTLSAPQLEYLVGSKYYKNRMAFFLDLVRSAVLHPTQSMLPGNNATILVGQVEKSEVQLAKAWDCDRKTVAKVIKRMNELGIVTTKKTNRTSVHTIHPVAAWIVDNVRIRNPYFRTGYVYGQTHEGTLAHVQSAAKFFLPTDGTANDTTHERGDLPKGSNVSRGRSGLLPTIENLERLERREEETAVLSTETCGETGDGTPKANLSFPSIQTQMTDVSTAVTTDTDETAPQTTTKEQ